MPAINLHHLRAFQLVAATGGIRRSADMLYRASSAVTRSVAALEESLGTRLFERKGRGMLPTAAGEVVRRRAQNIEAELREVRDDAARLGAREGYLVSGMDALFNERRLQVATMLADVHHMPTVAQAMGMSQSGVSQALAKLEEGLGQSLFRRTAHGMLPSDAGSRWIVRFNRVLVELDHILADLAALNGVLEGVVTVGALPLARTLVLPAAIAALVKKYPRVRVRSLESPYEELAAGLLSGRVDFVIGALRHTAGRDLESTVLMQDSTAVIARADHPLAGKAALSFDDLASYPWVLSRADTPLRKSLEQFYGDHGRTPPQAAVETGDLALLRGLLLSSDMLTVLSPHQLHYEIQAGQLAVLPFQAPGLERQIGVTTRQGAQLSPAARALLAELGEVAAASRPADK